MDGGTSAPNYPSFSLPFIVLFLDHFSSRESHGSVKIHSGALSAVPSWSLFSCSMANLSSSGWSFFSPTEWSLWFITNLVQGLISAPNTLSSLDELCSLRAKIIMKCWLDSSKQRELGNIGDAVFNFIKQRCLTYLVPRFLSYGWRLPPFIHWVNWDPHFIECGSFISPVSLFQFF